MSNKASQIIALLSICIGFMVIIGWIFDVTILTSVLPQWIRMKFATAICFVFSGGILFLISNQNIESREMKNIGLILFSMLNLFIMGTLFLGSLFNFQTGMENIGFIDVHELKTPIFQGRPSVATTISFILIATVALLHVYLIDAKKIINRIGWIIFFIGIIGVTGYIFNNPYLFYEIPGLSNAIAIHTTILFALLGLGIVFCDPIKKM